MKATATFLLSAMAGTAFAQAAAESFFWGAEQLAATSSPNAVPMSVVREMKLAQRENDRAAGVFDTDRYTLQAATACSNGKAGEYSCNNADLKGFLRHQDMGSSTKAGNDVWGWTSKDGREFGAVCQTDGTAFVEVLKDGSLVYMGRLPTQTSSSTWRDAKVIGDHVYIGSEASNHGLQIFDMKKLLDIKAGSPKVFSTKSDITLFSAFGSSHNIVSHPETNTIFAVGTSRQGKCKAGLWMVDVSNPSSPKDAGCVGEDGYVHDAQCVIYKGPDSRYKNKEICFNYNESKLTIVDVTDRRNPKQLSRTPYNGASYTHQGWLSGDDMKFLLLDDELDEVNGNGPAKDGKTATYIVDITDLTKPKFTGVYKSPVKASDHNMYVIDNLVYQSNYASGLRVVDISTINQDPTGKGFKEVAFFDVRPEDDAQGGKTGFNGAWSVYPYFKSKHILVNSIERGVFSVKLTV